MFYKLRIPRKAEPPRNEAPNFDYEQTVNEAVTNVPKFH